jgi:hypothetical protein
VKSILYHTAELYQNVIYITVKSNASLIRLKLILILKILYILYIQYSTVYFCNINNTCAMRFGNASIRISPIPTIPQNLPILWSQTFLHTLCCSFIFLHKVFLQQDFIKVNFSSLTCTGAEYSENSRRRELRVNIHEKFSEYSA